MVIIVDTREKPRAIVSILKTFELMGVSVVRRALPYADYWTPTNPDIVIDRKQNLNEICRNLTQERARFVREIERCNRAGCKMVVLIEHSNRIKSLEDVMKWKNPRLKVSPLAVSGERLYKIMKAFGTYYGVKWEFTDKTHTGRKIIEILGSDSDDGTG